MGLFDKMINRNKLAECSGAKKDELNHVIFSYNNKDYKYDDIYNLIKDMKYTTTGLECDWALIKVKTPEGKDALCLMFQETTSDEDWSHNFDFISINTRAYKGWQNKLKFHKGWFFEYQSARDVILSAIRKEWQEGMEIYVTGWSLGASVAPIACEDLNYQIGIKPIFIGYEGGNPCGNNHTRKVLYDSINLEKSISFEFASDIVPKCPPFNYKLKNIVCHLGRKFGLIDSVFGTAYYHTKADEGIKQCMKSA